MSLFHKLITALTALNDALANGGPALIEKAIAAADKSKVPQGEVDKAKATLEERRAGLTSLNDALANRDLALIEKTIAVAGGRRHNCIVRSWRPAHKSPRTEQLRVCHKSMIRS